MGSGVGGGFSKRFREEAGFDHKYLQKNRQIEFLIGTRVKSIGHFRVPKTLTFNTRLTAKPFL